MNKKISLILFFLVIMMVYNAAVYAQDTSDASFFSEPLATNNESNTVATSSVASNLNVNSTGFSGYLQTTGIYNIRRAIVMGSSSDWAASNTYGLVAIGDMGLDVRLENGLKAYAEVEAYYLPASGIPSYNDISGAFDIPGYSTPVPFNAYVSQTNTTLFQFNQFYLAGNIDNIAYFTLGQQVLKWGKSYFWSPDDLINIQRTSFLDFNSTYSLEGTFGLLSQVSLGTWNFYSFIDAEGAQNPTNLAYAEKAEFVVGPAEMSFSVWSRENYHSVFGYDFSTSIFKIDIHGEATIAQLYDMDREVNTAGNQVMSETNQWCPKFSIGFSRLFDFMNIDDRISLAAEFFYNGDGYATNVYSSLNTAWFITTNGLYSANYNSMYYIGIFTGFNEFILQEMTLNANIIYNLVDSTFTLNPNISYNPVNHFILSAGVYIYGGPDNGEYTSPVLSQGILSSTGGENCISPYINLTMQF